MSDVLPQHENIDTERNKKCKSYVYETIGWTGSILVFLAYLNFLDEETNFYLNIFGPLGIVIVCIPKKTYQPIIVNSAWIIGAFYIKFFKDN